MADSLFSSGYTFGGPTPPPPPTAAPYSPVSPLVERGITQLELMAKGFNNNNSNTNNNNITNNLNGVGNDGNANIVAVGNGKKVENKRRSECALYQETVERRQQAANGNKRRWERDSSQAPPTPPIVKSEVTSRPSCGCRRSSVTTSESHHIIVIYSCLPRPVWCNADVPHVKGFQILATKFSAWGIALTFPVCVVLCCSICRVSVFPLQMSLVGLFFF